MSNKSAKNSSIQPVYERLGIYCLVWLIAGIYKVARPFMYESVIEPGASLAFIPKTLRILIWIFFYLIFPWLIYSSYIKLIEADTKSFTAGMTLNGCCMSIICMELIKTHYIPSSPAYSCVILTGTVLGYIFGRMLRRSSGHLYYVGKKLHYSLLSGIIYGLAAGVIVFYIAPYRVTAMPDGLRFTYSGLSVAAIAIVYTALEKIRTIHANHIRDSFAEEMNTIRSGIESFDEKVARAAAARKAREEQERREQAAREKAERERKAREKAERERKAYEEAESNRRNNNRYQNSNNQSDHKSGRQSNACGSQYYFSGVTNKKELKRRYRQLCKKLHPDCPGGNAESFRQMQAEFDHLNSRLAS